MPQAIWTNFDIFTAAFTAVTAPLSISACNSFIICLYAFAWAFDRPTWRVSNIIGGRSKHSSLVNLTAGDMTEWTISVALERGSHVNGPNFRITMSRNFVW